MLAARHSFKAAARLSKRNFSSSSISCASSIQARGLVYSENGEPSEVIRAATWQLNPPAKGQALIKMGLASLNPADFNVIQGVYPSKPSKRKLEGVEGEVYVGGNEGFGIIERLEESKDGSSQSGLKEGDWVTFGRGQMGVWCDYMVCDLNHLIKIPRQLPGALTPVMASTLTVNPATALTMLREFKDIKENDVVVQNAANSAVGQSVIQMSARKVGAESINLVRGRPDIDALRKTLVSLGQGGKGTHVFTYDELADRSSGAREKIKEILKGRTIQLGLNAVCGRDTVNMMKLMGHGSALVTYGAMSKSPLTIPASMQIFSDISAHGFWMTRWYSQNTPQARQGLMSELSQMYESGSLQAPAHEVVSLGGKQSDAEMSKTAQSTVGRAMSNSGKKTFLQFGSGLGASGRSAAALTPAGARGFHHWRPSGKAGTRGIKSSPAPKVQLTGQINPGLAPPIENIGVDAVLRENPADPTKHTTTIFSEFSLEGRTAVISGGNGGLGLEIALAYVEAGAHVYAIDLPKEPAEEFKIVAEHCRIMDRDLQYISCTVTDDEDMNRVMEHIRKDSGSLDICVAAAGILQTYEALDYPVKEFQKVFDVNTTGVFLTARAAARQMHAQPGVHGSIILIASMSGSIVNRDHHWVAYNASKSAVLQMGRNLAAEWGPHQIRVNCISPGHIRTRMTAAYLDENPHLLAKWSGSNPLGRIGRSAEIRGVAVWLASDASSFCNGSDVTVSGGHQIW